MGCRGYRGYIQRGYRGYRGYTYWGYRGYRGYRERGSGSERVTGVHRGQYRQWGYGGCRGVEPGPKGVRV
jgi:hypothetical protein